MINANNKIIRNVIKQLAPFIRDMIMLIETVANDDEIKKEIIKKYPYFRQLISLAEYELPALLKPNISVMQQRIAKKELINIIMVFRDLIGWSLEEEIDRQKESLASVVQRAIRETIDRKKYEEN
jgi:hypothetical protein